MIQFKWSGKWEGEHVAKRLDDGVFGALNHAAAAIRLTARRSLRSGRKASPAGSPPASKTRRLKESIVYVVDRLKRIALVGPSAQKVGPAGGIHEHGGPYRLHDKKTANYPARPFMLPAAEKIAPRLPETLAASIRSTQ